MAASKFNPLNYFLLIIFSLILPTLDIYIDFVFACILVSHGSTPQVVLLGQLMFIPLMSTVLFTLPHWYKTEKNSFKRLSTVILVIFNLWPAYRVCRILHFALKKQENKARNKKLALRTAICYVEPFINSKSQIIIQGIFICLLSTAESNGIVRVAAELNVHPSFVAFSLVLSLVSANNGLARYLLYGPIRLYQTDGFFHQRLWGPVLTISMIGLLTFFGRHWWLLSSLTQFNQLEEGVGYLILTWFALCMVPQLLLVIVPLLCQFKFCTIVQLLCKFPGVLTISLISPFTIGIEEIDNKKRNYMNFRNIFDIRKNYSKYVLVTKKMTCINFLTSLICTNAGIWILELFIDGSAPNAPNVIFNSAICSSLQILAYLMILILFHYDDKCCFPSIERTCISPYVIYKIVDYNDLRRDNEEKQDITIELVK